MPQILRATDGNNNSNDAAWGDGGDVVSENSVWKDSVDLATTANITLDPAPATIDGTALADGDRVLLKDQTDPIENGIYVKTVGGTALDRAPDYEAPALVKAGIKVYTKKGTANAKKTFRLFSPTTDIAVGTTATSWEEDGGGGGGSNWATTLAAGNTSGGTDAVLSSGDALAGSAGASLLLRPAAGEATVIGTQTSVAAGSAGMVVAGGSNTVGADNDGSFFATQNANIAANVFNAQNGMVGGRNHTQGAGVARSFFAGGQYNSMNPAAYYYVSYCFAAGSSNVFQDGNGGFGQTGSYNTAIFGNSNTSNGAEHCFITGNNNDLSGRSSGIVGSNCTNDAYYAFSSGSNNTTEFRAEMSQAFGGLTYAYWPGQLTFGQASVNTNVTVVPNVNRLGALQGSLATVGATTTNATPTVATTTSGSVTATGTANNTLRVRQNQTITFQAVASAFQTGGGAGTTGDSASWFITGQLKRVGAGASTLVGAVTGDGTPSGTNDVGAATWDITVTTASNRLVFTMTGEASKNIAWQVTVLASFSGSPT